MVGDLLFLLGGGDQLRGILDEATGSDQMLEEGPRRRQFPANGALGVVPVQQREPAPDQEMRNLLRPRRRPQFAVDELPKLGQVGTVGGQGVGRGVALRLQVAEEGGYFRFHWGSFCVAVSIADFSCKPNSGCFRGKNRISFPGSPRS